MPHNPFVLFIYIFKVSLESLIILISLLSKMMMQSSSHSWPKEISEAICSTSKMCDFFVWTPRLFDNGMLPVIVTFIVAFWGNCTMSPL